MITRIVKLHFQEDKIQEFLDFFETIKHKVNTFPGCKGMRLVQDNCNRQTIMTISDWDSKIDLNTYRDSETFGQVWSKIKPWFENKPEVWTTEVVFNGFP